MFRYSICDPLKEIPIEMGEIERGEILGVLDRFPWEEMITKQNGAKPGDIHFSPSIEFENKQTRHGVSISIVVGEHGNEFYIFYKRPKVVRKFFGLMKSVDDNYSSDRTGQTSNDVREAVSALVADDVATLERRWG